MANSSRELFHAFVKKGLTDREALFAILDHYAQLHCFDRDRYDERVKTLEADNAGLKERLSALEKAGTA